MNLPTKTAIKRGLFIGLANLLWLYLAYFLGLHTNGIVIFQLFVLGWFLLSTVGFVLALRAVRRVSEAWGYWRGLRAGAIAAAMSAAVAVLMQIGYYTVVHPEWPDFMAEQTRAHFAAQGMSEAQLHSMVDQARRTFTLKNYAIQSAFTALFTGVFLSAIIMIFLRRPDGLKVTGMGSQAAA
jgi:hypothetical protein